MPPASDSRTSSGTTTVTLDAAAMARPLLPPVTGAKVEDIGQTLGSLEYASEDDEYDVSC